MSSTRAMPSRHRPSSRGSVVAALGWALAAGSSISVVALLAVAGAPSSATVGLAIALATTGAVARLAVTWKRRVGRRAWDVEVAT